MKIGIISDTHNFLDPKIAELFAGVEHILHAGDIGLSAIVSALEKIAPVTAVLGNNDFDPRFKITEAVQLDGRKFLVHHIVNPHGLSDSLRERMAHEKADVVVYGHTHRSHQATIGGTLFLNPGYAGRPRFNLPRSVAVLETTSTGISTEFMSL